MIRKAVKGIVQREKKRAHLFSQGRILFKELDDTIRELWVIHAETLDFVQGEQHSGQKELMLLLQRQGKSVDDRPQNF